MIDFINISIHTCVAVVFSGFRQYLSRFNYSKRNSKYEDKVSGFSGDASIVQRSCKIYLYMEKILRKLETT